MTTSPSDLAIGTLMLGVARLYAARARVVDVVSAADRWAEIVTPLKWVRSHRRPVDEARRVERALEDASGMIPGSLCLHRAAAGRVWLAALGVEAQVVVGVHRDADWQGHAWLEVTDDGSRHVIFAEEVEFRPVWRGK